MTLRQDVSVYNESTGLVFTCRGLGGRPALQSESTEWVQAVKEGLILAIELAQDDPVSVRVVLNDELTEREGNEWVDQLTAKLVLPEDGLALCGGIDYVENPEVVDEFVRFVDIPAGSYKAELYTYFTSPNFLSEKYELPNDFDDTPYVDFLLRLSQLDESEAITTRLDRSGWVPWKMPTRKLKTPPLGIRADLPMEDLAA